MDLIVEPVEPAVIKGWIEWIGKLWAAAMLLALYLHASNYRYHFMFWLSVAVLFGWVYISFPKWRRK